MTLGPAAAFASTATGYATTVLPAATRELARWREHAGAIPDPVLRRQALDALRKRGNMNGAALFAVFAPRGGRPVAVRALVAFQAAYNYLDELAEQPSEDPAANGRRLHEVLLGALGEEGERRDPYALHGHREDGGYLASMVRACGEAVRRLPSYNVVRASAATAARRIVDFQSLNLGESQGPIDGLRDWGERHTPPGSELSWWETAAAGGSSLGVHVLIGIAADPNLDGRTVAAVDAAYFPWIGALHSLLDSTVDVAEDAREGQRNLLSHYPSDARAIERVRYLTERARAQASALPDARLHEVLLTAMAGHYLSSSQIATPQGRAIAESVAGAVGPSAGLAMRLMRVGQRTSRLVLTA